MVVSSLVSENITSTGRGFEGGGGMYLEILYYMHYYLYHWVTLLKCWRANNNMLILKRYRQILVSLGDWESFLVMFWRQSTLILLHFWIATFKISAKLIDFSSLSSFTQFEVGGLSWNLNQDVLAIVYLNRWCVNQFSQNEKSNLTPSLVRFL